MLKKHNFYRFVPLEIRDKEYKRIAKGLADELERLSKLRPEDLDLCVLAMTAAAEIQGAESGETRNLSS